MANQKTTDLRRLTADNVAPGDILPIVDVSEPTTPTGETKAITAVDLARYVSSLGYGVPPIPALSPSNALSFDGNYFVVTGSANESFCCGQFPAIGTRDFSLAVKAYFPSEHPMGYNVSAERVITGVGPTPQSTVGSPNSAYLSVRGYDLLGTVIDSSGSISSAIVTGFFSSSLDKSFHVILSRESTLTGSLKIWVDGALYPTFPVGQPTGSINNSYVVIGNGQDNMNNIDGTIFGVSVRSKATTTVPTAQRSFFRGESSDDPFVLGVWTGEGLNQSPGQWFDHSGKNQDLLLPISGAIATHPGKHFTLRLCATGSGYLGGGSRDVLPPRYVLTSCIVESPGKPLLSIGTSPNVSPVSASITGSWQDNRVSIVSASYGVNPLTIMTLGDVHWARTIYVSFYSSSEAPCTFSFEGYSR